MRLVATPIGPAEPRFSRARIRSESRGAILVFHVAITDDRPERGSAETKAADNAASDISATAPSPGDRPSIVDAQPDAYWQYYEDCDRWGVVFSHLPEHRPVAGDAAGTSVSVRLEPNRVVAPVIVAARWAQRMIEAASNRCVVAADTAARQYVTHVARWEFAEVESTEAGFELSDVRSPALLPIFARMVIHELARPEALGSPRRWLQNRAWPVVRSSGIPSAFRTSVSQLDQWKQAIEARREAERRLRQEMTRTFARKVNWYAFQLHRWAMAVEQSVDADVQVHFDRARTADAIANSTR